MYQSYLVILSHNILNTYISWYCSKNYKGFESNNHQISGYSEAKLELASLG